MIRRLEEIQQKRKEKDKKTKKMQNQKKINAKKGKLVNPKEKKRLRLENLVTKQCQVTRATCPNFVIG